VSIEKNDSIEKSTSDVKKENIQNDYEETKSTEKTESNYNTFDYLKSKWIELIGLLIAVLAFFIPIYRYISQKREEQKDKRFQTYHQLIADLATPPDGKLDRQIATVYELRNFPNYFELTKRIMTDLINQWTNVTNTTRLITELNLSLNYIEKMSKWYNLWGYKIFGIK
jgi:hypothetical protein